MGKTANYDELLQKDNSAGVHYRNQQTLVA